MICIYLLSLNAVSKDNIICTPEKFTFLGISPRPEIPVLVIKIMVSTYIYIRNVLNSNIYS